MTISVEMFFPSLVITTTICFLYYYFTRTFNYWKLKNVKGPRPIPIFGNFKDIALRRKPKGLVFNEIYKKYPEEKVVGFYQMTSPALLIRDLDIVKQVMIKDFEIFPDRNTYFSKEGLGENIFHCDAETWKILRNPFSAVFTSGKFKAIFHLLVDQGDKFVGDVKNVTIDQQEQDVYKLFMKYTFATSMITVFGWGVDSHKEDAGWLNIFDKNLNNSYMSDIDMLFPGFMTKFNITILSKEVRYYCHQMLKACLQQPNSNETKNFNVKDVILNLGKENNFDMKQVNMLAKSAVKVTADLLAGQIWVFHTAGYLNNALVLTYAMYHLAHNPDVQEKLRAEIETIIDNHNGNVNYDVLKEMKYLDMVFEETLRINPLAHALVRSVSRDINLEGTNFTINKGLPLIISSYSIHHDEKYYPEPEKFKPERFSSVNASSRHPCAFLSFGAGRRGCLGSQFARIQFGICVVKLLQQFRIETSENTCKNITFDSYHMLMKPEKRIRLKLVPRHINGSKQNDQQFSD